MTISSPRESTIRKLFAVSQNQCAFPKCTTPIVDSSTGTILSDVCHIHAQNPGGPRYKKSQSDEERHGLENLVLMCRVHHKIIDDPQNIKKFKASYLRQIKGNHESQAKVSRSDIPELTDSLVQALKLSATTYDSGSIHMDFRDATFKVGGEGGSLGGGGGAGGVLTIVGLGRLPKEVMVDLKGQDATAPGGGGGGGGAISFIGRNIETEDIDNGLQISSIFTANAASIDNLLHVLGAAWSFCPVPKIPAQINIRLVFIVEFGDIPPGTMLRFEINVTDSNGKSSYSNFHDLEVPDMSGGICRVPVVKRLNFTVDSYGVWEISILGGERLLAKYQLEFREGSRIPL